MPGRILIIDSVPTNRVVLKAKMLAAGMLVDTCGTLSEAQIRIKAAPPDLVLINLSNPVEERHQFCTHLRNTPATAMIGIVVMGVADTAMARFAAIDAGADDVLPAPLSDILLIARIRSLMRARNLGPEVASRHSPARALGFEEKSTPFKPSVNIALIGDNVDEPHPLVAGLRRGVGHNIATVPLTPSMAEVRLSPTPDLIVFAPGDGDPACAQLFAAITAFRSRKDTALTTQLIVLPAHLPTIAATCLDLGADDVVSAHVDMREITLRARALLRRNKVAVAQSAARGRGEVRTLGAAAWF